MRSNNRQPGEGGEGIGVGKGAEGISYFGGINLQESCVFASCAIQRAGLVDLNQTL
jgi:hypothetical protein